MFRLLIALACLAMMVSMTPFALAEQPKRYASIVVDADTLEIIHARQIDDARFPASLTKVMTLYLTFDAINAGALRLDEKLTASRYAASTPPFGLGLRAKQTLTVDQAIQAVSVRSANDAAVVLAERIAGSEARFAHMMNEKARELGMISTVFRNPHGLPHTEQTTTARDMAKLASSILRDHRRYYHYFGQKTFTWNGHTRKNTNNLLHWLAGVDGFKTGFTNASGYNLVISAQRENRRLIAVVLGGASGKSRNKHMQDLVERGFKAMGVAPVTSTPPVTLNADTRPRRTAPKSEPHITQAVHLRGRSSEPVTIVLGQDDIKIGDETIDQKWSIQVGTFTDEGEANAKLTTLAKLKDFDIEEDQAKVMPLRRGENIVHRARFVGLSAHQAEQACIVLQNQSGGCLVIAPG